MPAPAPRYLRLPDGSSWPRPDLETDDHVGISWKLRYAPAQLTNEDHLFLASIVDAYGHLLVETTAKRRNEVCTQARKLLLAEVSA